MADNECPNQKHALLSEEELRALISESVQNGVHEGLLRVGLDTTDPIQLQRDFQFIRDLRQTSDSIRSKAILTTIGVTVTGAAAVIWLGIRALLRAD